MPPLKKLGQAFDIISGLGHLALVAPFASSQRLGAPPKRVLILSYSAIGDMVFFLPMLQALRNGLPGVHLTVVGNRYPSTELLAASDLADDIWKIEPFDLESARQEQLKASRRIRQAGFDAVLISYSTPLRFFGEALLSIPIRVGHCRPLQAPHQSWSAARYAGWRLRRGLISQEFERRLVLNRKVWLADEHEHIVISNLRLAEALGAPMPALSRSRPEILETAADKAFAEAMLPEDSRQAIGLHLGSPLSQYDKLWSPRRWGETCAELSRTYKIKVVLLGSEDEKKSAAEFRSAYAGPLVDLVGRCTLAQTASVIRRCCLFLSNDTGLSKIAMALRVPSATVFGPTSPKELGAVWDPERHIEIARNLDCMPCVRLGIRKEGSGVINYATCGHHACLIGLEPETVTAAIVRRHGSLLGDA